MQGAVGSDPAAVRRRLAQGRPTIVRLVGPGARAAAPAWLAAAPGPVKARWATGTPPDGAGAVWLGRGWGARLAADLLVASVALLDRPWLVVLTDESADAGPNVGWRVVCEGADGEAGVSAEVDGPLVPCPEAAPALQRGLEAAVEHGRMVEAAAWYEALHRLDPDRACRWRWVAAARAHQLLRSDGLAIARGLRRRGGAQGIAQLLAYAAFLVPQAQREAMLRAAIDRASDPEVRADARFLLDRSLMSHGAVAAHELRWPASSWLMARLLYFRVEKLAVGSPERVALEAEVRALGCDLGERLLHTASLAVDEATLEDWVDDARGYLALGHLQQAAFDLSGKTLAPGDDGLRSRVERGLARVAPAMMALPRLDRAVGEGDWATARRLAQEQLTQERYGGFLHTVMDVVVRVGQAVLDGDGAALVAVESEPLQEYLQPAFPELVEAAVPHAPARVQPRLLALAARWWARLGHEALAPCLEALEALSTPGAIPLGDYDMHEVVGAGGMGEVWRGVHVGLGETVAIKLLRASAADKVDLFLEEVELTARLDHEAIVHVHDAGVVGPETAAASGGRFVEGTPYLVMEYVPDGTLRSVRARLDELEVQAILLAVLDALAHAHARGVVHRDLKPDNLLVAQRADGLRIRLSDFGLAGVRQRGLMSGTPHYMAPEQFEGREVGAAADLYAVGCLATWLVTGRSPFRGSVRDLARAHRFEAPRALQATEATEAFDAWRLRLLAKSPHDRFPSAWAAREALRSLEDPAVASSGAVTDDVPATFVFATLAGLTAMPGAPVAPGPAPSSGARPALPEEGFRIRRARPRMPTTRLFARRDPPRVGHHRARQRLWRAARRAFEEERRVVLSVAVHPAVALEPLVDDLVLRLRELGVAAGTDPGATFEVAVGRAPSARAALQIEPVAWGHPGAVPVDRLEHEAMVAWLQAQVRLTPDLAWELARRALGSPRLGGRLLDEVLTRPVVPGVDGLKLTGALPPAMRAEVDWWQARLAAVSPREAEALAWASVWVPGFSEARHREIVGDDGVEVLARFARRVRGRWTLTGAVRSQLRARLREQGDLARRHAEAARRTTGARRALHLLHGGDPSALDHLLREVQARLAPGTRPPDGDLLEGLAIALDLDLADPEGEGRAWLALARARRRQALGRRQAALAVVAPLRSRADRLGALAWERWLDVAPAEALDGIDGPLGQARSRADAALALRLGIAQARAFNRAGARDRAETLLEALTATTPSGRLALGRAWASLCYWRGDLEAAARHLEGCAVDPSVPGEWGRRLAAAEVARRRGLAEAGALAEAVAASTEGPLGVRALALSARIAWNEGRGTDALRFAEEGLDYLVGTAWPEPRARLEAIVLAATADRPGDDWELRWLARSAGRAGSVAEALRDGAVRARAAGLADRARRLEAAAAQAQPRKG